MANWSDLPLDILSLFVERLPCAEEFVRFGAVCRSWRDAAIHVKKTKKKGRGFNPWMMLSKLENDDAADTRRGIRTFCDLSTGKFYNLQLPQLQGRRCWGTNYGWLIVFGLDKDFFLFHPLTQAKICLPSQLKFAPTREVFQDPIINCQNFIVKIAVSSDPSSHRSPAVMASFGSKTTPAFAYVGDKTWTTMTTPIGIADIIFFMGNFCCVSVLGELSVIIINASVPRTVVIAPPRGPEMCDELGRFYLVEICASLYLIIRSCEHLVLDTDDEDEDFFMGKLNKTTAFFNAYKLNFKTKKWVFHKNLEGHALFLGNNQSFAISPLDYPHFKPNCIYYTDDYNEIEANDYLDMGIYDYEKRTVPKSFDNCVRLPSSELSGSVFFMPQLS